MCNHKIRWSNYNCYRIKNIPKINKNVENLRHFDWSLPIIGRNLLVGNTNYWLENFNIFWSMRWQTLAISNNYYSRLRLILSPEHRIVLITSLSILLVESLDTITFLLYLVFGMFSQRLNTSIITTRVAQNKEQFCLIHKW